MGTVADLQIVYRNPAVLVGYPRNSRLHTTEQIAAVRRSIDEFGFVNPIALKDDETTIGAGHARQLAALLDPPLATVPTITLNGLTEAQWRAYVIADNRLAESGASWDFDILKTELGDLQFAGFDLTLTGFTMAEVLAQCRGASTQDPEATPDLPVHPVSRPGDLWRLGDHRIICGSSTDPETVGAMLKERRGAVCVSDPPYGIGLDYGGGDDSASHNTTLVEAVFSLAPRSKVWTPGLMNLARDILRFGDAKVLVWHKGFAAAGNGLGGASTWEPVLVIAPPRKKLADDHLSFKTDRERFESGMLRDRHPCPKPVALFVHLIEAFVPARGDVYEPFSGSGTTIIAAQMTGRICHAIELHPPYVDVAVLRWQAFAGAEATLDATGQTFAEVSAERLGAA